MKNKLRTILSQILLVLFVSYYGSITLFWHSHRLGNITIVHSHPFSNNQHSHSAAQIDLIKVLTETAGFIGIAGFCFSNALKAKKHLFSSKAISEALLYDSVVWFRRGPPVSFSA